jgi:hypothetical protein
MKTKKLKHGTKVLTYTYSDFSKYRSQQQYIHPTITIRMGKMVDPLQEYRLYGCESSLADAKKLREHGRDMMYVSYSGAKDCELRWQSDLENGYRSVYGLRVCGCDFDVDVLSVITKIAKGCGTWRTQPLQVVSMLQSMGAVCVRYNHDLDCHLIVDHLTDDMFGLPADQREGYIEPAAEETTAD